LAKKKEGGSKKFPTETRKWGHERACGRVITEEAKNLLSFRAERESACGKQERKCQDTHRGDKDKENFWNYPCCGV